MKRKPPLGGEELALKSFECSFTCTDSLRLELTLSLFLRVMLVVRNLHVYMYEITTHTRFELVISCVTGKRFEPAKLMGQVYTI